MSILCGRACQDRKDQQAQASLIQAQAQANLLNSLAKSDNTLLYVLVSIVLIVMAIIAWVYFKKNKK